MNSLLQVSPGLAKEWHPHKNGDLIPENVTPGSRKKVWWVCSKGHEWQAEVCNRSRGTGCPFCAGRRVCEDNCLETVKPQLAKEWHPTRNGGLNPKHVTSGSVKKVWWLCAKGHVWEDTVNLRTRGRGCPYCSGRRASEDYCLLTVNSRLASEWHPTRNRSLTPRDVTPGSRKKVWWVCSRGHEWKAAVADRNSRGTRCPFCAGRRVCEDNCLETVKPEIAKEWHPARNGSLTPENVTSGSSKRVTWICSKGHEWKATVNYRSKGNGCPYCSGRRKSLQNC